jgi:hypothetical protein
MKVILFWLIFCTVSILGEDFEIKNFLGNLDNDVSDRSINKQGLLIKKKLTSDKIIKRTYYKSGNIKTKTIAIPSVILEKKVSSSSLAPELMISKEYYDNVDGVISKITLSFHGILLTEAIFSNDGKEKCYTSFKDFKSFVYSELVLYKKNDIEFKDFDDNKQVMKTVAVLAFLLMPFPFEKEINCSYEDVSFIFKIKEKGIENDESLEYSYVNIDDSKKKIKNLEEAYNLLNKYYIPDVSVTNKLKKYKEKIMDFFK